MHKLFYGLIATTTSVSIIVSIPGITLADNHQPQKLTRSQLSCIHDKLQEAPKYDKDSKLLARDIDDKLATSDKSITYDKSIILKKLAKLGERRARSIVYICLNDNDPHTLTEIQKIDYPQQVAFNKIEPLGPKGTPLRHYELNGPSQKLYFCCLFGLYLRNS